MPHPVSLKALPVAPFPSKSSTLSSKSDNWSINTVISTPSTTRSQIPCGQKLIGMSLKSSSRINWLKCTTRKEDFTISITKNLSNWEMKSLNYWAESFLWWNNYFLIDSFWIFISFLHFVFYYLNLFCNHSNFHFFWNFSLLWTKPNYNIALNQI